MAFLTGRESSTTTSVASSAMTEFALSPSAEERVARQLEQDGVDGGDRGQRRRVDQRALDDHLDVHQPVADDGRGEGQRHEAEQERA